MDLLRGQRREARQLRDLPLRRARGQEGGPVLARTASGGSPTIARKRRRQALLQKATGALSSEVYEWGTQGRTLKPLLGQGETTEYDVSYARRAAELLVSTNKLGDFRRLYRWKAAGGFAPVTADLKMDVSGFSIDPARKHVYYTLNDGGYTRLRVLDAATLQPAPFPEMKDADHVSAGKPTRDGRYVTLGVETSRAPRTSYVYDWETKSAHPVGAARAPPRSTSRSSRWRASRATRRATERRSRCSCATPPAARPRRPRAATPARWSSSSTAAPRARPSRASAPAPSSSSTRASSSWSPTCAAATATGRRGSTPTTGPKRLHVITDIEDAGKYARTHFARGGKAPKVGDHGRQLRRLLDAHRDDDVRRHLRRGRVDRRLLEPRHVPRRTPRPIGACCASPSTAIRTRTRRRCGSSRPSPTSTA